MPRWTFVDARLERASRGNSALRRNVAIVGSVLLFHVLAIWAFQTGLLHRAITVLVPVMLISEITEPPRPTVVAPPLVVPPRRVAPKPKATRSSVAKPKTATAPPPPAILAIPTPAPEPAPIAPAAPVVVPAPVAAAPLTAAAAGPGTPGAATGPAAPSPPAPAKVAMPSSDAGYLQNPKPLYPPMSKRLQEQGTVLLDVLVGADGSAKKVQLKRSSGFDRLDKAAISTVQQWRFVPGTRAGVPEAMAYDVPITFRLE